MKWRFTVFGPLVLALCVSALPLHAQTSDVKTKPVQRQWYDASKEVTLTGTVSSVEKTPARGTETLPGSYLVVETNTGRVNASLGRYAMAGKSTFSVASGQQVQITGVMKTIRDQQVFVARIVQMNGRAYTIRNEHGFAYASMARGQANSGTKGGTL